MPQAKYAFALLALAAISLRAEDAVPRGRLLHQVPDKDGTYYMGPEVTAPRLVRTVLVPYPEGISGKQVQGMTVLAMVIDANGIPAHIEVLHTHGETFDQIAIAAVKQSNFEPGSLHSSDARSPKH